jgi:hypothetical protein
MLTTKSNINFQIDRSVTEGLNDINSELFPNHFLMLLCGKRKKIFFLKKFLKKKREVVKLPYLNLCLLKILYCSKNLTMFTS